MTFCHYGTGATKRKDLSNGCFSRGSLCPARITGHVDRYRNPCVGVPMKHEIERELAQNPGLSFLQARAIVMMREKLRERLRKVKPYAEKH